MSRPSRILAYDALRTFAIVSVVAIHSLMPYRDLLASNAPVRLLDDLLHYAVPLFVFISGALVWGRPWPSHPGAYRRFLVRRGTAIGRSGQADVGQGLFPHIGMDGRPRSELKRQGCNKTFRGLCHDDGNRGPLFFQALDDVDRLVGGYTPRHPEEYSLMVKHYSSLSSLSSPSTKSSSSAFSVASFSWR